MSPSNVRVQVVANKQHQLADWRLRPLPQELIDYARSDTHYLLYIFDKLRNEILTKSIVKEGAHEENKVLAITDVRLRIICIMCFVLLNFSLFCSFCRKAKRECDHC